ncbi:hypothetical protein DR192_02165 [Lawsonia intracellularis]|nr:hypothetical protein DR194_01090 [Lawsonia intracellularis]RBN35369.1 hypothetical protein DR192_02165 [Lawsonia intracellularis]RBN35992.1 hypothetical protein DR193_01090 [Lawsonia intracellularis]
MILDITHTINRIKFYIILQ